jgi:hypothetical protein
MNPNLQKLAEETKNEFIGPEAKPGPLYDRLVMLKEDSPVLGRFGEVFLTKADVLAAAVVSGQNMLFVCNNSENDKTNFITILDYYFLGDYFTMNDMEKLKKKNHWSKKNAFMMWDINDYEGYMNTLMGMLFDGFEFSSMATSTNPDPNQNYGVEQKVFDCFGIIWTPEWLFGEDNLVPYRKNPRAAENLKEAKKGYKAIHDVWMQSTLPKPDPLKSYRNLSQIANFAIGLEYIAHLKGNRNGIGVAYLIEEACRLSRYNNES